MKKFMLCEVIGLLFSISSAAQSLNIYCENEVESKPKDELSGFCVEMISQIQKRVKSTLQVQIVPWARGLKFLDTEPNTMLFSMARTAERNKLYQWIGPIAEDDYGFYTKVGSKIVINNIEDARKVASIGVIRGDIRDQFLTKAGFTNLERANSISSNFRKFQAGRFDVIASSPFELIEEVGLQNLDLKEVKLLFTFLKTPIYIGVSKNTDPRIVTDWNAVIDSMKNDGSFNKIYKKYYSNQPLPSAALIKF